MTQTTEQLPELDWAYVAKSLAPHLRLSVPKPAPRRREKLFTDYVQDAIFSIMYLCAGKGAFERSPEDKETIRRMQESVTESDNQYFEAKGIKTPIEKEAFSFAHFAGLCLGRYVDHLGNGEPVSLTQARFEESIDIAVQDGLRTLQQSYKVNPDFELRAKNYLSHEVHKRAQSGLEFNLLERIKVKQEDGLMKLQQYWPEESE